MDELTLSMEEGDSRPASEPQYWGPFRLLEKVGQGAFGQVYRAWDSALEREVALKLLLPRGLDEDAEAKAILREARLIARVRNPNVVPVYGVDRHDGRVGFWSDFVRGKTLSALLSEQGSFGPREAALIGIELCKALSAVHAAGLLHRDIKAGNVMREEGGRILLMDFGLTHETGRDQRLGGTPAYLAPEVLAGQPAMVESDIYALGVLLFHLVTDKYPVDGAQLSDFREAHESGSRRRLMDERPDLPERFVHVIETAIDRDPKKRFATAGQMFAELSEAAGMGTVSSESVRAGAAPKARRFWMWLLAPVLGLAALIYFVPPVRSLLPIGKPGGFSTGGAHADYSKAQDLLDHYYKPHSLENAIALFQKTIDEDPKFALAYAGLGRAYWYQYRSQENSSLIEPARNACDRAVELDRDLASAHVTLGMIYTQTGRSDLAADELKQSLHLDARSADAYGALAELYAKQGRDADVETAFQKAIDLAPTGWRWRNQLGLYYLSSGKLAAAAEQFQEAVKLSPDNARAYNNLGIAYRRQNRLSDASAAYEKSIQMEPAFNTFSNLGAVLQEERKYSEAAGMYQRSIDLNPSSYIAWGNLASAYDEMPGGKAKARETYRKATSLAEDYAKGRPNDPRVLADIGHYYALIGIAERSLPLVRQAVALAPDDPQILYRVAEAYESLHHREEALHWIGEAFARGLSLEIVKRNPELSALRADPRFPAASGRVR